MDWVIPLIIILGGLIILMATGMPVAFCFLMVAMIGMFYYFGGELGLRHLTVVMRDSVAQFTLLPLALFVLMGEVISHSGIAPDMLNALDKWLGRLPGRLSLLAVAGGTLLSTLTGTSVASVIMLGSTLVPEMTKRGYKKSMALGPILGSGGLAIMIPPSGLAVLIGAIGSISIGGILLAIIIPGLVMAAIYAIYVIIRAYLQPELAPSYIVPPIPLSEKVTAFAKYVLPVGFIVFMVVGVILLGVATPSQAAATGALGCFILVAAYGRLNWELTKRIMGSTIQVAGMILLIMTAAVAFSQVLARSGASNGLVEFVLSFSLPPIIILIIMQLIVMFMGCFLEQGSIAWITIPLFIPIINALGFNTIWFAVIILINLEMATITPPFGLSLFAMKGVVSSDYSMGDIIRAALPFVYLDVFAMALIMAFPVIALWLPSVAK